MTSRLRVSCFAISVDGYGAGSNQSLESPPGVGGLALHEWAFATRTFRELHGETGGSEGADNDLAERGFANVGAWIMGRNMFGALCAAPGRMYRGAAGGSTILRITSRSSS